MEILQSCTKPSRWSPFAILLAAIHPSVPQTPLTSRRPFEDSFVGYIILMKMCVILTSRVKLSLQWRHNERDSVSNHQPHDCLVNRLFRRRSEKTSKLRVTGLCVGNSPGIGEFPAQMARYAENVSIWWRHHACWYYSPQERNIFYNVTCQCVHVRN